MSCFSLLIFDCTLLVWRQWDPARSEISAANIHQRPLYPGHDELLSATGWQKPPADYFRLICRHFVLRHCFCQSVLSPLSCLFIPFHYISFSSPQLEYTLQYKWNLGRSIGWLEGRGEIMSSFIHFQPTDGDPPRWDHGQGCCKKYKNREKKYLFPPETNPSESPRLLFQIADDMRRGWVFHLELLMEFHQEWRLLLPLNYTALLYRAAHSAVLD